MLCGFLASGPELNSVQYGVRAKVICTLASLPFNNIIQTTNAGDRGIFRRAMQRQARSQQPVSLREARPSWSSCPVQGKLSAWRGSYATLPSSDKLLLEEASSSSHFMALYHQITR